ncbi:hypothetical protein CYQ88_01645 [Hydrogenovibrio sp. SC-1]|uniref:vWA domain-containing protein n=1 Tax=Hydrogenovibrio sp. SC-1 TaxID=2065820 RepID=UPI000C7BE398|nr:VWA domain-containing protein [Hydrogenovibrio sp. SC-1]PLA75296.1 hypothetical protein CYQ88_01645 [Hydrogenovibrio sp. SC-1]
MNDLSALMELVKHWDQVIFVSPDWFWGWMLLVGLSLWHRFRPAQTDWQQTSQARALVFRHSLINHLSFQTPPATKRAWSRWLLHALRWLLLTVIILALAEPVYKIELPPEPQTKTVRDIVFVVETSVSMGLEDYQVSAEPASRLDAIKSVLDSFIAGMKGNRFSLILYAESAYTLMPLTADGTTARLMLKRLMPYLAGRTDEATGEALGLALQQTEQATETTRNRVVVLISDGLNANSRLPLSEAVNYAQGLNVPIYTIGVGAEDASADQRTYSGLIYQTLDASPLQSIADQTDGRYYRVGGKDDLQTVLQQIDQTEGVEIEVTTPKFQLRSFVKELLMLGMGLFVLYFIGMQWLASNVQRETT